MTLPIPLWRALVILFVLGPAGLSPTHAENAIRSCYDMVGVDDPATEPERHLFVLVDQTTLLDDTLKAMVADNVKRNLSPGVAFTVASFSSFLGNRYSSIVLEARMDVRLTDKQRHVTGKSKLEKLDRCYASQADYAAKLVDAALEESFGKTASGIPKSDVAASLQEFAKHAVAISPARDKVVLVVSDMLENSSISSFYGPAAVRRIDPAVEFDKFDANELIGDFSGARTYVIGAGLLAKGDGTIKAYRDPDAMKKLEDFWGRYLSAASAELVEFGKPALIRKIEWEQKIAVGDAIKSCYEIIGIERNYTPPARHVFVFIDQTTVLNKTMQKSVRDNLVDNLEPGTAFTIATFSAFFGNRYNEIVLTGRLDTPLSEYERFITGKTLLAKVDRCLAQQGVYAIKLANAALDQSFADSSADIPKSDVVASLHDFAKSSVALSDAGDKLLLLVSDMLENSSITSFYASNSVRRINPAREMEIVRNSGLVADFDGARVFVIGAGLISSATTGESIQSYRDSATMNRLEGFWETYFDESSAQLIEMGQPALLRTMR